MTGTGSAAPGPPSFDAWYERQHRQVLALVYVLCGSRWAAEELTQDAFLEAHRNWARIALYDDPSAWVRAVAVNKTRSWGRRRSAEARAYARHMGRRRDLPLELSPPTHEFWAAVRALPRHQAQVVALHYLDDRPVDEIAQILDLPVGTVKSQLHRGRATLARSLGAQLDREVDE